MGYEGLGSTVTSPVPVEGQGLVTGLAIERALRLESGPIQY